MHRSATAYVLQAGFWIIFCHLECDTYLSIFEYFLLQIFDISIFIWKIFVSFSYKYIFILGLDWTKYIYDERMSPWKWDKLQPRIPKVNFFCRITLLYLRIPIMVWVAPLSFHRGCCCKEKDFWPPLWDYVLHARFFNHILPPTVWQIFE